MTSAQQRAALQRQIWQIANEVRGAVDGWDFKQYVLGTLFYRFISENFAAYMEGDDDSVNYAEFSDGAISSETKDDAIKTKGYFISPSHLFENIVKNVNTNDNLNTDLDYVLELIFENNKKIKDKAALVEDVRRVVRANLGTRAKESLLVDFINQAELDQIDDKVHIIDAFFIFAQNEQQREAEDLINAEKLNDEAARRYLMTSLKREFASDKGTELNAILPKMSPLNPQYLTKKKSVFTKISAFVEKFKGVGGTI